MRIIANWFNKQQFEFLLFNNNLLNQLPSLVRWVCGIEDLKKEVEIYEIKLLWLDFIGFVDYRVRDVKDLGVELIIWSSEGLIFLTVKIQKFKYFLNFIFKYFLTVNFQINFDSYFFNIRFRLP